MTIPDDRSLRCPTLETDELKRLSDVVDMRRRRFPRAGDHCTFLTGVHVHPPITAMFVDVHVASLSPDESQITFTNDVGTAWECAVDDNLLKWWFADEGASAPVPAESCYDASVLRGIARADKLKTVWDVLRAELETASASLSKIIGGFVKLKIVTISESNVPFTASEVRAFCKSSYEPVQICAEIRLLCPSLQYESSPLAYVLSHFEGLPFLFTYNTYKDVDSSYDAFVMVAEEDRLPEHLQSVLKKMLSGAETGLVVRTLMDRIGPPAAEPEAREPAPRAPQENVTEQAPADNNSST